MAKERRALAGKVVAITGGARGIGKATAAALVRRGCRVAIGDLDVSLAEETAAGLGGGTVALPLDVTDRGSFSAFLDEAERQLGPIDVIVNNAGIMPVTPFVEESEASIRRQVEINLLGPTRIVNMLNELGVSPHLVSVSTCYVGRSVASTITSGPAESNGGVVRPTRSRCSARAIWIHDAEPLES